MKYMPLVLTTVAVFFPSWRAVLVRYPGTAYLCMSPLASAWARPSAYTAPEAAAARPVAGLV